MVRRINSATGSKEMSGAVAVPFVDEDSKVKRHEAHVERGGEAGQRPYLRPLVLPSFAMPAFLQGPLLSGAAEAAPMSRSR